MRANTRAPVRVLELDSVRRRLREAGLVEIPIDEVADELAPETTKRVRYLETFARGSDLNELLGDPRAQRAYTLLAREAQIELVDGLLRWMDQAQTATVAKPGKKASALIGWATEHGVAAYLDRPISELTPFLAEHRVWLGDVLRSANGATVRTAALGRARVMGFTAGQLSDAAKAYLEKIAKGVDEAAEREKRWTQPPSRPVLARLLPWLHAIEKQLSQDVALAGEIDPIELDPQTLVIGASLPRSPGQGLVSLSLVRHEEGVLVLDHRYARTSEELTLVREVLDVVYDRANPMHDALGEALELPAWSRMANAVDAVLAKPALASSGRLAFLVSTGIKSGRVVIDPIWQQRTTRGWQRGKRASVEQQAALVDPRERMAMTALSARPASNDVDASVLSILEGHPAVLDSGTRTPLAVRRVEPRFAFCEDDDGLRPGLALGPLRMHSRALEELAGASTIALLDRERGAIFVGTIPPELAELLAAAARFPAKATQADADTILPLIEKAAARVPVALPEALEQAVREAPLALFVRLTPEEGGAHVEIRSRVSMYVSHPAGEGAALVSVLGAGTASAVLRRRDLAAERHAAHRLAAEIGLPDGELAFTLENEDALLAFLDTARAKPDVEIEWPDDSVRTQVVGSVSSVRVRVKSAAEWFGVEGEAEIDGERVKLASLLAAIRAGKRFVKIGPKRYAAIEAELRAKLTVAADVVFESQRGALSIAAAGGDALEALSEGQLRADDAWTRIRTRLRDPSPVDAEVPSALTVTLRDYQRAGFAWLARLASLESGAILADDMGLGKTIQALALLVYRGEDGPALVVTPTSVSDNWLREAARFAPSLRMRLHRGPGRHAALKREPLAANDVLVASYDVVALDHEVLAETELATLVLDEAQWIKNPDAQRTKAVRKLAARVRIALTGTPLENRLSELWSIVSTVHPGLLGTWDHFRGRFAVPIERDGDSERLKTLSALVRPYLLRRTKEVVAPELPPRIEIVREIELSEAEQKLYDTEREAAIAGLTEADESKRFEVLASITRLRQLACDTELVVPGAGLTSSKLAALMEIVDELETNGRRVLVFSQFVRLLERVALLLDARKTKYLVLDGSTPAAERHARVERFMRGEATVFLLSLKAGGTGLNLTAADHVIHLDPWWNPAVEDQASDRAHRIGQDKPVTIIRLVAKGTIEEHVLSLHDEKRALSRGVLDGTELAGALSAVELVALIRAGANEVPKRESRASIRSASNEA